MGSWRIVNWRTVFAVPSVGGAALLGISLRSYQHWEARDVRRPDHSSLVRLAMKAIDSGIIYGVIGREIRALLTGRPPVRCSIAGTARRSIRGSSHPGSQPIEFDHVEARSASIGRLATTASYVRAAKASRRRLIAAAILHRARFRVWGLAATLRLSAQLGAPAWPVACPSIRVPANRLRVLLPEQHIMSAEYCPHHSSR
jgi:hypothetical protein